MSITSENRLASAKFIPTSTGGMRVAVCTIKVFTEDGVEHTASSATESVFTEGYEDFTDMPELVLAARDLLVSQGVWTDVAPEPEPEPEPEVEEAELEAPVEE